IAQMIRNLTASTLNGWDEDRKNTTDLTEMHANFRIDRGQAVTNDQRLAGPLILITRAGTTDLNTNTLSFRIEPKLVMMNQSPGSSRLHPDSRRSPRRRRRRNRIRRPRSTVSSSSCLDGDGPAEDFRITTTFDRSQRRAGAFGTRG